MDFNLDALKNYNRAIELDPTLTVALINRCGVYSDLKEYDKALVDCDAVLAQGEIPVAYVNRGAAYHGLERFEEAKADYQRAIDLLPGYVTAYSRLATLYADQMEYQKAIEASNQALALEPGGSHEPFTLQARGRTYYGLGDYEQAIQDLTQAINGYPAIMSYYYRGIAYQANGQKQEAISDFSFMLKKPTVYSIAQDVVDDAKARLAALQE